MRPLVKINRKEDAVAKARQALLVDQDYHLASLYMAMQRKDGDEIQRCKENLRENLKELAIL